jgi:hypothetical protein
MVRMMRTITLRLSDEAYEAVKRHADAVHMSMNSWIEGVLDAEDMRLRCAAHAAWIEASSSVTSAALAFGQANQQALAAAGLPSLADGTTA